MEYLKEVRVFKYTNILLIGVTICLLMLSGCASQKKAIQVREYKLQTILKTARSYTGTPYQWGGTTRKGMDCSALLLNSYKSIGLQLPRTSQNQSNIGKGVSIKDLAPGDLVFFATGKRRRKVTHAGIITEVKGDKVKFIHASTSLGVVETNLNSEYYMKRFVKARRLL
jgi:probable lipoprotein NlpC